METQQLLLEQGRRSPVGVVPHQWFLEKVFFQYSQTADLTELDFQSTLTLTSSHNVFVLKLQQDVKSYDSDQRSLKWSNSSSLSDRNLNTDMRIPSEQILFLQNLTNQVKSDVDGSKINGLPLSLKLSLPLNRFPYRQMTLNQHVQILQIQTARTFCNRLL